MRLQIDFKPKFNDIPEDKRDQATEAFTKHLVEGLWFIGPRKADVLIHNIGSPGNPSMVIDIDIPEAEIHFS